MHRRCFPYRGSLYGGNAAYRREAALAVGMFDTQLGRGEDSDLMLRLQDAGHEIWWLPGAAIWHFVPVSRMKFRGMIRGRFNDGRFIAIQRLKSRRVGWDRGFYRIARIVGAPFHALAQIAGRIGGAAAKLSKGRRAFVAGLPHLRGLPGMLVNWTTTKN